MNERSKKISELANSISLREAYLHSKLDVLVPAQIRSLRRRRELTQSELGEEAGMKQARICAIERPGQVRFNLETLVRLAAAFRVGLSVRFLPMSEMLAWENSFMPDEFDVVPVEKDEAFINYGSVRSEPLIGKYAWEKTLPCRTYPDSSHAGIGNELTTPIDYSESRMVEPYVILSLQNRVGYPSTEQEGNHVN